jgi:stearoyl-CoA desaturase (delta-9 desaturase)
MPSVTTHTPAAAPPPVVLRHDWSNIALMGLVHLVGLAGLIALVAGRVTWQTVVLAIAWNVACSISITGGYHRLFSHVSYRASWPLRLFYLVFGAASVQNSALRWSHLHRLHHAHCDTDGDPYNAQRGFWWSHIAWIFYHRPDEDDFGNVPDLSDDALVQLQHRFYLPLVLVVAVGLPVGIAALWGDALGGLLVAVGLRLVFQYHSTFAINSFAHVLGGKHYSTHGTPRDSWVTALLTLGEGYHDFHHRFPADYRNGVRPFDFDPTKWWVWGLSRFGLTRDLRRISNHRIAEARSAAAAAANGHAH